jgi:hypothetical protein
MRENVTQNTGARWTPAAVHKLQELWGAGVPGAVIAQTLGRLESEIGAKAVELKLPRRLS